MMASSCECGPHRRLFGLYLFISTARVGLLSALETPAQICFNIRSLNKGEIMAKSIADQLMGLGLADKKQVQKDKAEKRKQQKQARKHKTDQVDEAKVAAEKARKEKAEKDRLLNLELQKKAEHKALLAQVKQIIERTHIRCEDGEVKFNFADRTDNKIKFIYVNETMQNDLAKGKLAIATYEERYFVVTQQVAEKIAERSADSVVFLSDNQVDEPEEDDPYKDFVIPDDLMW